MQYTHKTYTYIQKYVTMKEEIGANLESGCSRVETGRGLNSGKDRVGSSID